MSCEVELASWPPPWAADHKTLFSSQRWYSHWFKSFAGDGIGEWRSDRAEPWSFPYAIRSRRIGLTTVRVVYGAANNYSPQFDVIGDGVPTLDELRELLSDLRGAALVVPLLSATSRFFREGGYTDRFPVADVVLTESAPLIDCTGNWDEYLKSRRKSRRTEWFEKERKLLESGAGLNVLSTWDQIGPLFTELLEVEASGWKGRKGTSIAQVEAARRFFEGVCPELANAGKLRVFLVRQEERIVAFKLCTLHGGRLSSLKTGYREALAKQSPGLVLQLWVARWCFEQPEVSVFDFLGPATSHKLAWATSTEDLYTLYVYNLTPGGAIAWSRWSAAPRLAHHWRRLRAKWRRNPKSADDRPEDATGA